MTVEMSDEPTKRQDFVDNAIFELIQCTNPTERQISWDIEMIGNIRDSLVSELQNKLGISEFDIYP
jgi:hypothetical protein